MSRTPALEMRRLEAEEHPGHETVVAKGVEFQARCGLSTGQFADLLGVGESTLHIYLRGDYQDHTNMRSTQYMDAKVWPYIVRHWPRDPESPIEQLLETRAYWKIRECIDEAVDVGASSLIYGPPSSEKSFVAECLVARYRAAGRRDVLRIICDPGSTPLTLLKDIAREAEVWLRGGCCRPYREALVQEFLSRERPPAIIVDEAQNLNIRCIEVLRVALHERTKRGRHKGCGLVLMGSHNLYAWLTSPERRFQLEQFFSRNSYRVQLEGMTAEEVLEIGARAFAKDGKRPKLTEQQKEWLLRSCRVLDPYATDPNGKPLRDATGKAVVRTYYSSRRLLEAIRQKQRKAVSLIVAEEVA